MFGILSNTFKTATREDVWGNRRALTEDEALMSEMERRTGNANRLWRAPADRTRR